MLELWAYLFQCCYPVDFLSTTQNQSERIFDKDMLVRASMKQVHMFMGIMGSHMGDV